MQPTGAKIAGRVLVFVHIPKAAGTTLRDILDRQFARHERFEVAAAVPATLARFNGLSRGERHSIRDLSGGHLPYAASGLTSELDNGQVRLLCGIADVDSVSGHGPSRARRSMPQSAISRRTSQESVSRSASASRCFLFSRRLDWPPPYYLRRNVTEGRPVLSEIPERARQAIARLNALDMKLYSHGERLFEAMLRESAIGPKELARFRSMNRGYQLIGPCSPVTIAGRISRHLRPRP